MRIALTLTAALGLVACNSQPAGNNNAAALPADNTVAPIAGDVAPPAATPATTPDFINRVAISDMFEIEAGKLAITRTRSPDVKAFAQMMVHDHTATSDAVKAIVSKDKLPAPPAALDDAHARLLADLKAAKADDFDTTYLDQQTTAHEDALALLTGYGAGGDNADLKAFANETAPKVQTHLDRARALDKGGADDQAPAKPTP